MNQNDDSGSSTDEYEWDAVVDSPFAARSNTTASVTAVTASCDVCLNAACVKIGSVPWEMQLFVSNVLTHSSPPILTVLCVAV